MAILACLAYAGLSPSGTQYAGFASVIDGDTIEIQGRRIRLYGIDAPESRQTCRRNGQTYRCGQEAAKALADKIALKTVTCEEKDVDRYGRVVAICAAESQDMNQWMVAQGQARAYLAYSLRYLFDEMKARTEQRGLWRGEFQNPWDYRQGR